MKKITLTFAAILCVLFTKSQTQTEIIARQEQMLKIANEVSTMNTLQKTDKKSRAIKQRLVRDSILDYDGVNNVLVAAEDFTYSGGRGSIYKQGYGGVQFFQCQHDETNHMQANPSQLNKRLALYNAADLRSHFVDLKYNTGNASWDTLLVSNNYQYQNNLIMYFERVDYVNNLPAAKWKYEYTYNANNNITSETSSSWDNGNNMWVYGNRILYTYSGLNLMELAYESWINNTWAPGGKLTYTYDANNKMKSERYTLAASLRIDTMFYDANNRLEYLYRLYPGPQLVYYYKLIYSGNDTLCKTSLYYEYDGVLSDTVLKSKTEFVYDANNNVISDRILPWNGAAYDTAGRYYYYYYEDYVSWPTYVKNIEKIYNISLYPNPATISSYINVSSDNNAAIDIKLTDINGTVVYSILEKGFKGDHLVRLPLIGLSKGIYVLSVQTPNQRIHYQKLIKE